MRTTIAIDDDVIDQARGIAGKLHKPFRAVINDALRAGLSRLQMPVDSIRYKTDSHEMGLRRWCNLDNIQELLAQVDGEDAR